MYFDDNSRVSSIPSSTCVEFVGKSKKVEISEAQLINFSVSHSLHPNLASVLLSDIYMDSRKVLSMIRRYCISNSSETQVPIQDRLSCAGDESG